MLATIFGPSMLIVVLLGIALPLWAIVDALSRPAVAFYSAGSNKTAWVIVLLVVTFVLGIGSLLAAFYLLSVRRTLQQQLRLRRLELRR
jgi:hypothetical protein